MPFSPPPPESILPLAGGEVPTFSPPPPRRSCPCRWRSPDADYLLLIGSDVGGPDETNDNWTNRGYSSTGPNLTRGIAAVNPSVYPIGSVLRDVDSGELFLAADKHGNRDPNVVDLYVDPADYELKKETRNFALVGSVPEKQIPKTPEGIRSLLDSFGGATTAAASVPAPAPLAPGFTPPPPDSALPFVPPAPEMILPEATSRPAEFLERIKRGAELGTQDVQAGFRQQIAEVFRGEQNPYLEKTTAEAAADVPKLKNQLDAAMAKLQTQATKEFGKPYAEALSPLEFGGVTEEPSLTPLVQEVKQINQRLGHAMQASGGVPTESYLGALSRTAAELAEGDRASKADIAARYKGKISPARDKEYWMKVADSVGQSLPGTGAAMLNPVFGLGLMYTQTYEGAREEYLKKNPKDLEGAHAYASGQAALQTPFEAVGDVAFARLARETIKRIVKEGASPKAIGRWIKERAVDLGKATAGEVLVTTPTQTAIEQSGAEVAGLRAATTPAQKAAQALEASKVALGQSLFMGGGPVAAEAAVRTATGGFERTSPAAAAEALAGAQVQAPEISAAERAAAFGSEGTAEPQPAAPPDERFAPPGTEPSTIPAPTQPAQPAVPDPGLVAATEVEADKLQRQMTRGPAITVVATVDEAAAAAGLTPEETEALRAGGVEAFYDHRGSGQVVLIVQNFAPREGESHPSYVRRMVMHEAAGHGGLARLFEGPLAQQYGKIVAAIYNKLATQNFGDAWRAKHGYRTLEELAQWYGYDWTDPEGIYRTIEEHLARLAESPSVPRWYDEVISQITYLMRNGFGMKTWTNADTRVLLARARDQVGLDRQKAREIQSTQAQSAVTDSVVKPTPRTFTSAFLGNPATPVSTTWRSKEGSAQRGKP